MAVSRRRRTVPGETLATADAAEIVLDGLITAARAALHHQTHAEPDTVVERVLDDRLPLADPATRERLARRLRAELTGLGAFDEWLDDPRVSEVIVNAGSQLWVERDDALERVGELPSGQAEALIERIVPPSYGSVTRQLANLGAVRNSGWEFQVNALPLDRKWLAWDLNISASLNANEVESLGNTPPQIGTASRVVVGYPIGGLWAPPILGWEDKNKDGILTYWADPTKNEVFVGDSAIFRGYSTPRYIATLVSGFDLLSRRLRLQTLFDYRGGHKWYNDTERLRCQRPNCGGRNNPKAPFDLQAANIARLEMPIQTLDGYFQSGPFVRLREASVQYTLSPSVAQRFLRARTASVVVSGRNLALWTNYPGTDPETAFNFTSGTDVPADFQTIAPPSYFIFRINLGY